jgi:Ca-activated chloride channel family protein
VITDWRFLHPWLLLLLPLPLVWLAWHYASRARRHPSVLYSDLAGLAMIRPTLRVRLLGLLPVLRAVALLLGILALARPQYGQTERRLSALGLDIALAIDVSNSMMAEDFQPNRLEVAKDVVQDFVAGRESDRISVVVFGATAAVLSPPTFDRNAVNAFVDRIHDGMIDNRKTAIGMGLGLSLSNLEDSEAKSRIVVLLTDGENNEGIISPEQAAEMARALGVRVYTIGMGTNDVMHRGPWGMGAVASFDEESLRMIAEKTGGRYYAATNTGALRAIYEEIDRLEKTEIEIDEYENFDERFMLLWLPGLLLLAFELVARGLWLGRLP